ncbi:hypothetical protein DFJ63DRAFT_215163 [Scheffersomyces coipomensis]|uniref:uncharacterized protein n=1 Tax=Scheffersomyces coipomensis TaxID=1788519 RepID=UPI00315CF5A5
MNQSMVSGFFSGLSNNEFFQLNRSTVSYVILSIAYAFTIRLILNEQFSTLSIAFIANMMMILLFVILTSVPEVEGCQHPGKLSDNILQFKNLDCACIRTLIFIWALSMLYLILVVQIIKGVFADKREGFEEEELIRESRLEREAEYRRHIYESLYQVNLD